MDEGNRCAAAALAGVRRWACGWRTPCGGVTVVAPRNAACALRRCDKNSRGEPRLRASRTGGREEPGMKPAHVRGVPEKICTDRVAGGAGETGRRRWVRSRPRPTEIRGLAYRSD